MSENPKNGGLADLTEVFRHYLSMADTWTVDQHSRYEIELRRRGLPSVSAMMARTPKSHLKILERGRAANDNEYYFVRGLLADADFPLSKTERIELTRIESEFENRSRQRSNPTDPGAN